MRKHSITINPKNFLLVTIRVSRMFKLSLNDLFNRAFKKENYGSCAYFDHVICEIESAINELRPSADLGEVFSPPYPYPKYKGACT